MAFRVLQMPKLSKKSCFTFRRGLACSNGGYSPLALHWPLLVNFLTFLEEIFKEVGAVTELPIYLMRFT